MVAPNTAELNKKKAKERSRKPNISSARKKQDSGRNVEVSMRTFEENIRENKSNTGEKNPIIGEIMYTFKDKNVPVGEDATDIESAFEAVKEFINVCTVSVTARLVTDDDTSYDKEEESIKPPAKPMKKPAIKSSNESKALKKIVPLQVPQKLKQVESSQVISDTKCSTVVLCDSQQVGVDIDVTELEDLSGGRKVPPLTQTSTEDISEPMEFDLLSSRPRKKRVSFYSRHKTAYASKKYDVCGDSINKKEMTMHDLIFYNPKNNPMSNSQESGKKNSSQNEEVNEIVDSRLEEEMLDDVDEENSEMPVPQLKLSADGNIILDPKSLVVQTSAEKSLKALQNSAIIEENGKMLNPFIKAKKKYHSWTPLETLRFYRALNTIGTDFSLMQTVFPDRTRYDLKKKFKKEERTNRELIDKTLSAAAEFDVDMLEEDIKRDAERAEMQRKAKEERAEKLKKEKEMQKKKKKALKRKGINLLDGDTGTFENRKSTSMPFKGNTAARKKLKKFKRLALPNSDTSEEDEPQFDSLYPSDDELTNSQIKMLAYQGNENSSGNGHKKEAEHIEIENVNRNQYRNVIVKTESESGNTKTFESSETRNESINDDLNESGFDATYKSATLYGNQLIGINNDSESDRNEEKENENLNVNDTVTVNEFVILSENLGESHSKYSSYS